MVPGRAGLQPRRQTRNNKGLQPLKPGCKFARAGAACYQIGRDGYIVQ
jgi:hypothetical protein